MNSQGVNKLIQNVNKLNIRIMKQMARHIKRLLTEREVCTVKYQTEVHAKNRGLIFHSTDRTSEVSNRFII